MKDLNFTSNTIDTNAETNQTKQDIEKVTGENKHNLVSEVAMNRERMRANFIFGGGCPPSKESPYYTKQKLIGGK